MSVDMLTWGDFGLLSIRNESLNQSLELLNAELKELLS